MSKRNRRDKSNAVTTMKPPVQPTAITTPPTTQGITTTPAPMRVLPATSDPSAKWRWLLFVVLILCLTAATIGFTLYTGNHESRDRKRKQVTVLPLWNPPLWKPTSDDDLFIDRFVRSRKDDVGTAQSMLAALPADNGPVNEDQFEARAAGLFLRDKNLTIVDVWKGEPDRDGKPRAAQGRYMLITRGRAQTPHMQVRDEKGNVSPTSLGLYNPVIVVEVSGGKDTPAGTRWIQPLRTEMNRQ